MTDKQLRKLNRAELLQVLLDQSRQLDQLRAQLEQANARLNSRQLMIDHAGSIAEASIQINQVFEAAQQAAAQYLENIQDLSGRQEAVCARLEADCRSQCEQLLAQTQEKCRAMEAAAQKNCEQLTLDAKTKASDIWGEATQRLDELLARQDLRKQAQPDAKEPN